MMATSLRPCVIGLVCDAFDEAALVTSLRALWRQLTALWRLEQMSPMVAVKTNPYGGGLMRQTPKPIET